MAASLDTTTETTPAITAGMAEAGVNGRKQQGPNWHMNTAPKMLQKTSPIMKGVALTPDLVTFGMISSAIGVARMTMMRRIFSHGICWSTESQELVETAICDLSGLLGLLKFLGQDSFDLFLGFVEEGFSWDVGCIHINELQGDLIAHFEVGTKPVEVFSGGVVEATERKGGVPVFRWIKSDIAGNEGPIGDGRDHPLCKSGGGDGFSVEVDLIGDHLIFCRSIFTCRCPSGGLRRQW